jgi:uncharacterized protein (DUF2141 family)
VAALPAAADPRPATATLEVSFTDLRSAKGVLQVCLTASPKAFPDCAKDAHAIKRTVSAATPQLTIEGVPPGDYAIAVIHDANRNAKLDTMMGVPREGFGFSRNPRIMFGPPRFKSAQFALAAGAQKQQVRIRYLL